MSNPKKDNSTRIDTVIIFLVAACMIFLIDFAHDKLHEFDRMEQEALLVNHNPSNPIHEDLAKEIIQYRPGAYKMIEIYTPDFEIMMTLQFAKSDEYSTDLSQYPDLVELFYTHDEGHTQITVNDKIEDIYFRWTEGANNNKYLIIVYASRAPVKNLAIFDFVCYIVLLLMFMLLFRLRMKQYREKIKQYKDIQDDVRNRISH